MKEGKRKGGEGTDETKPSSSGVRESQKVRLVLFVFGVGGRGGLFVPTGHQRGLASEFLLLFKRKRWEQTEL